MVTLFLYARPVFFFGSLDNRLFLSRVHRYFSRQRVKQSSSGTIAYMRSSFSGESDLSSACFLLFKLPWLWLGFLIGSLTSYPAYANQNVTRTW